MANCSILQIGDETHFIIYGFVVCMSLFVPALVFYGVLVFYVRSEISG